MTVVVCRPRLSSSTTGHCPAGRGSPPPSLGTAPQAEALLLHHWALPRIKAREEEQNLSASTLLRVCASACVCGGGGGRGEGGGCERGGCGEGERAKVSPEPCREFLVSERPKRPRSVWGAVRRARLGRVGPMVWRQCCTAPARPSTSACTGPLLMYDTRRSKKNRPGARRTHSNKWGHWGETDE